jgi:hypothetical protein
MCQPPAKNFWPLFNNPKLDKELRALVLQNFQEFCNPEPDGKCNIFYYAQILVEVKNNIVIFVAFVQDFVH